jgi:hypothetical protein
MTTRTKIEDLGRAKKVTIDKDNTAIVADLMFAAGIPVA